jgi:hypothetical protein
MVRRTFQNPQGIGPINRIRECQSSKINSLKETLLKHHVDILGLAEVNKDWRIIPQQETMWHVTEGWFEYRRLATSINARIPSSQMMQFGGTMLLAMNKIAYNIVSIEEDPQQLG